MQSIWSVPQAAPVNRKANTASKKRANFSEMMKDIFMTKSAPKAAPRQTMHNPRPVQHMPVMQHSFETVAQQAPMGENIYTQSAFSINRKETKKKGGMVSFLAPMVFAFLGIPFYVMAILKFIGMLQS
jgi:hypothetical protein